MIEVPDWLPYDVSRETFDKFLTFAALIEKWTKSINLIAGSTANDIFQRHIWDSVQVFQPFSGKWVDMGSGGGFPGVVIAILTQSQSLTGEVVLIESDQRKATFLRTCARQLDVPITVIANRIERVEPQDAKIVSARALSRLTNLFDLSAQHLSADGMAIFQKGSRWRLEINEARKDWLFSYEAVPSKTDKDAAILKIKDIQRV